LKDPWKNIKKRPTDPAFGA